MWEGSWQGVSSLRHKLYNVTYREVKLPLVPRVKASLLIEQLLHVKRLHQVDADLSTFLPAGLL